MAKKTDSPVTETILEKSMGEVMHESMMPYAEYVILERALPRVEDGLKPVLRRILYTMHELNLTPDKPHKKSARVVGDALGKYHPHGDTSVYDAMVRMAQPFNMRMPLIDGQGNFGSIDGDPAAAMRYTEVRMTPLALELLRDIDKDTVDFALNFDDSLKEPVLLPGRFPNLLVNGATGIAVGLATNIPPHNLGESIDAVVAQIKNPDITLDELMKHLPCPDFPTGGLLVDSEEIRAAYETGRGKLTMRARTHFETQKNGRKLIIITEIPYQVNKAVLLEKILAVTQEKKSLFAGVCDIRDESDRSGMRAVIELKKDADEEQILRYLYKYSDLQCTFGANIVAIAGGKPKQLGLKELITHYIRHQYDVLTRRTKYELDAANKREHILSGLMIAIDRLDEIIALIRASKTPKLAREGLMKSFKLTEIQAQAILDLRLQRLTNLELLSIQKEYAELIKLIKELNSILASEKKLYALMASELLEIKQKYANSRRTKLIVAQTQIEIPQDELAAAEDVTVAIYDGLKARRAATLKQTEETPLYVFETSTDKNIRLFTDMGACLMLPVKSLSDTSKTARPINLAALLPFNLNERIIYAQLEEDDGSYIFLTEQGFAKQTLMNQYSSRTKRIAAINLKENDKLIMVEPVKEQSLLIVTRLGMCIRFLLESVPQIGRVGAGVRCIKLDEGDSVLTGLQVKDEGEILAVSNRGYAKRTLLFDYELQNRNGKGLKTFDFKKNGSNGDCIAAAFYVREAFDFSLSQRHGKQSVFNTEQIRIEKRASSGSMLLLVMLDDDVIKAERIK